jgi:hypothetical protein
MRLSIDITPEQHQLLKVAATLQGESIKDYVLKRTIPNLNEQEALQKLEEFLSPRIDAAKQGKVTKNTIDEIFNSVLNKG